MDPLAILALLSALVLIALTLADIHDAHTDDDEWFDNPPVSTYDPKVGPPIPIDQGPRDAA